MGKNGDNDYMAITDQKQIKSSVFLGYVLINVGKHAETESLIKKKAFQKKAFFGNMQ